MRNVFLKQIDLDALRCVCVCVRGVIVAWWDDAVVVLTVMVSAQGAMAAQAIKQVIFIKSESILFYTIRLTCVHTLYKPAWVKCCFVSHC